MQHDITDCGAACIATICKQNGYKIGITQIREIAGTDKQGTNVYGVIKAAEQLGFNAKGGKEIKRLSFQSFRYPVSFTSLLTAIYCTMWLYIKLQKTSDYSRPRSWNCKA